MIPIGLNATGWDREKDVGAHTMEPMTVEFLNDVMRVLADDTRNLATRAANDTTIALRAAVVLGVVATGLENLTNLLNTVL